MWHCVRKRRAHGWNLLAASLTPGAITKPCHREYDRELYNKMPSALFWTPHIHVRAHVYITHTKKRDRTVWIISLHDLGHHLPCLPWDLQAPLQYILGPQKSNLPAFPGTLCAPTPLQVTDNTSCLNYSQLGKVSPGSICVCFQEYELVFSGRRKDLDISTFPKGPGNMFVSSESLVHKPGSLFGKYFWKVFSPITPFLSTPVKPPSLPGHWLSCIFQLQCHISLETVASSTEEGKQEGTESMTLATLFTPVHGARREMGKQTTVM